MGRLLRHIVLAAWLMIPGISSAQLIQNTATAEVNAVAIDLSQATVTLNKTAVVDASLSSVTVNPPFVLANGVSFSTITVTLRNSSNQPLGGRFVSLASARGALDVITQPLGPTDVNGVITGEIRSVNTGVTQILATDVAESVLLDDQPDVLFALGDVLQLTKTINTETATIGDVVTYSIDIQNTTTNQIIGVSIVDAASPVLAYVPGTARLDGVAIPDPVTGPPMIFDIGDMPALADTNGNGVADPGESGYRILTYSMVVGAGARVGMYANTAHAISVCSTCVISPPATAELEVIADPIFDLGTIIGRVFHDTDGNGWMDPGEQGISGAMVALDEGVYALTDAQGRYHFPAIEPGQRMVKINLPRISGNAHATTGATKVLTVTPGLLAKANFGVSYEYDTESIGADGQYGVKITKDGETLPDQIYGSADDLSLMINGAVVDIARVNAALMNADANSIIHLEDDEIQPMRFELDAPTLTSPVIRWTLNIWRDDDKSIKVIDGVGTLPNHVQWDDIAEISANLLPGQVYFYQLEVELEDARMTSARRMFGVNRATAIVLELRGGAFLPASATLTEPAKNLLTNTASIMAMHSDETVRIIGHTDSTGSSESNQVLSEARARAAFDYLVNVHALNPERFFVAGYGEDKPIASNDTETGRALNRRVEVYGDLTEVERSRLYETRTNSLLAEMNGITLSLDGHGHFTNILESDDAATVNVQMTDKIGRSIDTAVAMPRIQLAALSGIEYQAFEPGDPRHENPRQTLVDASYAYRVVGQTDAANVVRIDDAVVPVDSTGGLDTNLQLRAGENNFVLSVENENGLIRYADIRLAVSTNENGAPILAVQPVPTLVLQLPPQGVAMRSRNLLVPGFTDPGNAVMINDQAVDVDDQGQFVATVALNPGVNTVSVRVTNALGYNGEIQRDIMFTGDSMFIMALADAKISQIRREGNLQGAGAQEFEETRTDGRVALYLKGTIRGKYLITAAFDTGTNEIGEMFKDFNSLENERLITNIDPDTVYPVYGDDSTLVYDADSQSKLYLALEGEHLETVVGNYALSFDDAELTTYKRTLHGMRAGYNSDIKTSNGESIVEAEAFVAQVDQVSVRDEIAATGGSLYFLSQTDVIEGSEQVVLLVHDQNTGLLLQRITQKRNVDYDVKYREGRIWFRRPISSVIDDGGLIGANLLQGNPITIQVNYESPVTNLGAGVTGGRLRTRLADGRMTFGVTHIEDDRISSQYSLDGVDAEIKLGLTRIVAEYASSTGADSVVYRSTDGGLQFTQTIATGIQEGTAYKVGAEFDVGDWFGNPGKLLGNAYYKNLSAGFVANGNFSVAGDTQFGAAFSYEFDERNSFQLRIDDQQMGQTMSSTQSLVGWRHERGKLSLEVEFQDNSVNDPALSGSIAAVRGTYRLTEQLSASLEHQEAISGAIGTQTAAAMEFALHENLSLTGRYVTGPDGRAWQGGATWDSPLGKLYAQQVTPETRSSGGGSRTLVGAEAPFGEGGTVYTEYQWDHTGQQRGLRSLAGIRRDWRITEGLSLLVSGEQATQQLGAAGVDEQVAIIGGASFDRNGLKLSSRNEARRQRGTTQLDQFASFNYGELKLWSGITVLGEYRLSTTDDLLVPAQSTEFEEASFGFAIRPVDNDRWNVLFKMTQLDSDATPTQQNTQLDDSTANLFSADWSVQLTRNLEWVGKHAMKTKLTSLDQLTDFETNTSLSIQRLNVRLPWNLSIGTEYRLLQVEEADDSRSGFLGELMWRGFDHVGLGVGYNFTEFNSDLRFDSDYSEYGWFLRIQGTY